MTQWVYAQRKTHAYLSPYVEILGKTYATPIPFWFGKSFGSFFVTYTKGVMTWYADKQKMDSLFEHVSSKVLKKQSYLKSVYLKFIPRINNLLRFSEQTNSLDLSKKNNKELWEIYREYVRFYEEASIYGEPVPMVTKDQVTLEIRRLTIECVGKERANEVISLLSTSLEQSFIAKEEQDLLKLGAIIQKKPGLLAIFKRKNANEIKKALVGSSFWKLLLKHEKKYCWLPYDYGVQVWNAGHFIAALKNYVSKRNCAAELKNIEQRRQTLGKMQRSAIQKYQIPKSLKILFEYIRLATYIIDFKKETFTKSHYLLIPLLQEIAKRLKTTIILERFMTIDEIRKALIEGKQIPNSELERRYTLSVCIWDNKGKPRFLKAAETRKFIQENIQDNPDEQSGLKIYGTCASIGMHTGRVKIVMSAMHVMKVNHGDVLVAPMTSPDYVIGMKKAGAIVTDEGGITCHAAIVSRELRIPCIVGTGNATKVFKDGDLVEVNAIHGSVRKVEK